MSGNIRPGLELISEAEGDGAHVERHAYYRIKLRMWLHRGDPVRWSEPWGVLRHAQLVDDGETLITCVRLHREHLVNGLFYGCLGMRIGGTRTLKISPHLAYGDKGIPGIIPPNALLTAEISVLARGSAT